MRYLVPVGVFLSLIAGLPAHSQKANQPAYEPKLKAYTDCVAYQFRKNASEIGNTLEAARKAQNSCNNLYEETIRYAESEGELVAIIKNSIENSREFSPELMVKDFEWIVDWAATNAVTMKIQIENCPNVNREIAQENKEYFLEKLPKLDARLRDEILFSKKIEVIEKETLAKLFNPDGTPNERLSAWCKTEDIL